MGDIGMGMGDIGAQACEIVGLFLLSLLEDLPNFQTILYRDDGLGITTSSPRLQEKLKQSIIRIFAQQELKITIEINLTRVNYLDITMDLKTGFYQPYRKPGDRPLYVSATSNHPPQILKNIPKGIEQRLSDNSANKQIFDEAAPPYQAELERCGYKHQLTFNPRPDQEPKKKKSRSRRITWFNPPYSMGVATNVGQEFLKLIDKHFPPGHILHSVLNRSTVKVSYRCLPRMGAVVAKHNAKILHGGKNGGAHKPPSCNCQKSKVSDCPLPGACNSNGVVYQAVVRSNQGGEEFYVGLAKNFKNRYSKHKASLNVYKPEGNTSLSTHYWAVKEAGGDPKVEWKILEKNIPIYNPVTKICRLCLREKFNIVLKPHLATLNSRQEIFAHCRHMELRLIGKPPD